MKTTKFAAVVAIIALVTGLTAVAQPVNQVIIHGHISPARASVAPGVGVGEALGGGQWIVDVMRGSQQLQRLVADRGGYFNYVAPARRADHITFIVRGGWGYQDSAQEVFLSTPGVQHKYFSMSRK